MSPGLLNGSEIRFLRKNLRLKIDSFARMLGVDRGSLSRWENGRAAQSRSADRLIRLIYAVEKKLEKDVVWKLMERFLDEDTEARINHVLSCSTAKCEVLPLPI